MIVVAATSVLLSSCGGYGDVFDWSGNFNPPPPFLAGQWEGTWMSDDSGASGQVVAFFAPPLSGMTMADAMNPSCTASSTSGFSQNGGSSLHGELEGYSVTLFFDNGDPDHMTGTYSALVDSPCFGTSGQIAIHRTTNVADTAAPDASGSARVFIYDEHGNRLGAGTLR